MDSYKASKLFDALKGNQLNPAAQDFETYSGTGLYFEGVCSSDSVLKISEGKDGTERKIVEEAEFKASGGVTLFTTLWHDTSEGEMPHDFKQGERYKLFLKKIQGGWNEKLSKWQFQSQGILSVSQIRAKRSEKRDGASAA